MALFLQDPRQDDDHPFANEQILAHIDAWVKHFAAAQKR